MEDELFLVHHQVPLNCYGFLIKVHLLTLLGSLQGAGLSVAAQKGLFAYLANASVRRSSKGEGKASPDDDGGDDAVHNYPVTLHTACYPGGAQRSPGHLGQEECQADVQQLGHGLPWPRVADGP